MPPMPANRALARSVLRPGELLGESGHFHAGIVARIERKPREYPRYFLKPGDKNSKNWMRGYDRALAEISEAQIEEIEQ